MNRLIRYLLLVFLGVNSGILSAQSPTIRENSITAQILDRLDVLYGSDLFTSNQNFPRKEVFQQAKQWYLNSPELGSRDRLAIEYLLLDNEEWRLTPHEMDESGFSRYARKPLWQYFYKTPSTLWAVDEDYFKLRVNPIANFHLGQDATDYGNIIFQNTRGLDLRAYIDEKVYVFTSLQENQARFNDYHERRISQFQSIPGNGFYKNYRSGIINEVDGWDFLNAQAYIGAQVSKSIAIEFGHGRHQIGQGLRSLLLSRWSHNYFYLKFRTQVWKFHYQNIFAELAPISDKFNPANTLLPRKYMANHYLSFRPNDDIELGFFETVVFSRQNQFELQYLNPVILYRTVEQFLDSPDNVLIGLNGKWNLKQRAQLYGQLILDEFKVGELTSGNGWWANKYGYQLGIKYFNLGNVDQLDAQVEINTVRPYTYSHRDTLDNFGQFANASYSHYNQPLAHPAGANFRELILQLTYRPSMKWHFLARGMLTSTGVDRDGDNWGSNILAPNTTRVMDFGNVLSQGESTTVRMLRLYASYMFFHNYHLDFHFLYRNSISVLDIENNKTVYFGAGLRVNLGQRVLDY